MRRPSPTGTRRDTGKRWTAAGIGGVAAGAAVVCFGGLYAAGLLLAGEDVAPGRRCAGSP
ncbi:hypothetical protein WKI68_40795 [Streptomyces sp. MS1.HAVA.3]|uniref:Uncharacterized protein n=1 Tax=Streptomyces caledonius TaxID=3134107 RepID=A0ABU8UFF4_9ACTN